MQRSEGTLQPDSDYITDLSDLGFKPRRIGSIGLGLESDGIEDVERLFGMEYDPAVDPTGVVKRALNHEGVLVVDGVHFDADDGIPYRSHDKTRSVGYFDMNVRDAGQGDTPLFWHGHQTGLFYLYRPHTERDDVTPTMVGRSDVVKREVLGRVPDFQSPWMTYYALDPWCEPLTESDVEIMECDREVVDEVNEAVIREGGVSIDWQPGRLVLVRDHPHGFQHSRPYRGQRDRGVIHRGLMKNFMGDSDLDRGN